MKKRYISIFTVLIVLQMFVFFPWQNATADQQGAANWTFMVYLDADNPLELHGIDDMNEMELVGSDPNVHILVQLDRIPGYDSSNDNWTGTRRYHVTHDADTFTIGSNITQDLGEVNMGDPISLISFVNWSMQNYPADHYCLVLWDHGDGYNPTCWDYTDDGDSLTMHELQQALDKIQEDTGVKLDILGFDTCSPGTLEVAYQLRNGATFMVGSQEILPGDGWPYDTILSNLKNDPSMSPSELASEIVTKYVVSYSSASNVTLSAINLTTITGLPTAVSNFAQRLTDNLSEYRVQISEARLQVENFSYNEYIDLYHFAQLINTSISDPAIQNTANQVMTLLMDTVIAEDYASQHPNAHGLSIWFPNIGDETYNDYKFSYEKLNFAVDTSWDEFLARAVIPVIIDQAFVSDDRADVCSNQKVGFHLKWVYNNSDVIEGNLYINGTAVSINGTGWAIMNVTSDNVGRQVWSVTAVDIGGVIWHQETAENSVYISWASNPFIQTKTGMAVIGGVAVAAIGVVLFLIKRRTL